MEGETFCQALQEKHKHEQVLCGALNPHTLPHTFTVGGWRLGRFNPEKTGNESCCQPLKGSPKNEQFDSSLSESSVRTSSQKMR